MTLFAYVIGLLLPGVAGWFLVRVVEGRTKVLLTIERVAAGLLLGITCMTFLVFLLQLAGMPIVLQTYLLALGLLGGLSALFVWLRRKPAVPAPEPPVSRRLPRWIMAIIWILGIWTVFKIVTAATVFLFLTPTYLDDTLDNWNLRAKVFYVDQALTMVLPNEDPLLSPRGISSYPPSVPLAKTWLVTLRGTWSEGLVNGIHVVWYLLALVLVYGCIRRLSSVWSALLGVYVLSSLPLYLMHGTNPYADCFLSAHLFLCASMLLHAWLTPDKERMAAFLRLAGLAMGVLVFTKNEGVVIYLPVLLLIAACIVFVRRRETSAAAAFTPLIPLIAVALPWLAFKWLNGLTFGNAKPFTTFDISWHSEAVFAVLVNTFFEGNWLLLLPLLFTLLIWKWRSALRDYLPLTAFFLIVYVGQMMLYFFTTLSVEATLQTGYARGLIHFCPIIVTLTVLLLERTKGTWQRWTERVTSATGATSATRVIS